MKKYIFVFLFAMAMLALSQAPCQAMLYTFAPDPIDLNDLVHAKAYRWGIEQYLQPGEVITRARLQIFGINNWAIEEDILYIHLLRECPVGVRAFNDVDSEFADYFDGRGILLDEWTDDNEYWDGYQWVNPRERYTYRFKKHDLRVLNNAIEDGTFGFGFDPDCHYYNNGIRFQFETEVVPEPATIFLLASGILGLGVSIKKKGYKK